jgi:hypothetical protein
MVVRALGWLLLVLAVAAVVQNALTWWADGAFHVLAVADMWAHFDYGSFAWTQSFVSEHVSARGWSLVLLPVLRLPAVLVFLVVGVALLWAGQPGGARGDGVGRASAVGMTRPRRRRGRGRGELS